MNGWWSSRSNREQRLLAAASAAVVFALFWFAGLAPLQERLDVQTRVHAGSAALLTQMTRIAAEVDALGLGPPTTVTDERLAGLVRETAATLDIPLELRPAPDTGRIRVRIDTIEHATLMQWLTTLRSDHQLIIERIELQPGRDGAGIVADIDLRPLRR